MQFQASNCCFWIWHLYICIHVFKVTSQQYFHTAKLKKILSFFCDTTTALPGGVFFWFWVHLMHLVHLVPLVHLVHLVPLVHSPVCLFRPKASVWYCASATDSLPHCPGVSFKHCSSATVYWARTLWWQAVFLINSNHVSKDCHSLWVVDFLLH